jgi:hypothetical protein
MNGTAIPGEALLSRHSFLILLILFVGFFVELETIIGIILA